jgi:hypothetical protein
MQNGSHSNTGGLASTSVLRASGGLGTRADDVGTQDGVGHGSTLFRSDLLSEDGAIDVQCNVGRDLLLVC